MRYEILVDRTEKPAKCSILPLAYRADVRIVRFDRRRTLPTLTGSLLLHPDGMPLNEIAVTDAETTVLCAIDCNWRRLAPIIARLDAPQARHVRIPDGFRTAYPRRNKQDLDPASGLATVEALFVAAAFLGVWDETLLDEYPMRGEFLRINAAQFSDHGLHPGNRSGSRTKSRMQNVERAFRGWTRPGPVPPGALGNGPQPAEGETLDAISGHFRIFQLSAGHRFSTDDVLTAWYGTSWCPSASRVLDLGSGIGTVGMIAAWRLPGARVVAVEAQAESVALARRSADWNGLGQRYEVRRGDFRRTDVVRPQEDFDLILGSPPYFPRGSGIEGDHPQKIACRFEMRGDISDYCATAALHLAGGGIFACVFPVRPSQQHERLRKVAADAGLAIVRWRPVTLREGEPSLLGLFVMMRSSDLPTDAVATWEEPPLVIRRADGAVHAEYSAVKLSFGFPP
ncbi:MAG TPA: methyltransferase [Candidatus Binatia bacterium]|nr:methyltransferase [Candidatus Binatia bacterium]